MDRLGAMWVVLAAADAGSLSAAGRTLGLPLATVSRKVSDLEAHLRTQIFIRSSRSLTLTEAGRAYVEACRRILEDLAEAERAAAGEYAAPRGDLVIATPIVFGRLHVLPVILNFLDAYPNIDVKLVQSDRVVHLVEDHIDVAIRIGELPDSNMVAKKIGETRQVVCASPEYFKNRPALESPADLAHHVCVTFEQLNNAKHWTFPDGDTPHSASVRSRLIVNSAEAAIDAAIAGSGITRVLSYQVARCLADGRLVRTLENFEPPPTPIHLLYPGQGRIPIKLRAFLDFAAPRLRESLQPL
ncbi:MAG: LysR family transcriptional regulator [Hyphomonadaceae bacterium BRH_c29]|nr:MAG: LysR family transcriptional regulator [Hyphomonadaceae bacterium BRH_c29]